MGEARYTLLLKRSAEKELDRLPTNAFDRVASAIDALRENPRPHGAIKLHGADKHRLRVGEYRVLYTIDDASRIVEVVAVGHRRDVYRDG